MKNLENIFRPDFLQNHKYHENMCSVYIGTFILGEISRVQHQTLVKLSSSIICKEIFSESPMTSKYVKRFRENVVVYQSSVDTKEAHHSNDISTTKKDVSNLVGTGNFDQ